LSAKAGEVQRVQAKGTESMGIGVGRFALVCGPLPAYP
jgi:hypothetical protein